MMGAEMYGSGTLTPKTVLPAKLPAGTAVWRVGLLSASVRNHDPVSTSSQICRTSY